MRITEYVKDSDMPYTYNMTCKMLLLWNIISYNATEKDNVK